MSNAALHKKFAEVVRDADLAGRAAVERVTPVPMFVGTPKNMAASLTGVGYDGGFDEDKPVWLVPDGVCGFATVRVYTEKGATGSEARKFQNWLKGKVKTSHPAWRALGALSDDNAGWQGSIVSQPRSSDYFGGVGISVSGFGQSLQRKEAYANAFRAVVSEHIAGVRVYTESRED